MPNSHAQARAVDRHGPARAGKAAASRATKSAPAPRPAAATKRALIVGSDSTTLRVCRDALQGMGFAVDIVNSGVAAVVAARGRVPDVILMESQLRDVPAPEAIGWLRSNTALKSVPVVVITGSDEPKIRLDDKGVSALLRKPLSPAAVERTMRELYE